MKIALMSFAHVHAIGYVSLLSAMPDVELLVSDPDHAERPDEESGGAELAASLGVAYVDSYDELLAWGPDAVVVTSENVRHRAHVELAAAAGAAVLCEKPLATTVEDATAMVDACAAAGVPLMVAFPVRFSPAFVSLRAQHAAGSLGELLGVTGTNNGRVPDGRSWFTDPALSGGGALTDHVVHIADMLDALTDGTPAVSVHAVANTLLHPRLEAETAGIVTITYANGLSATIDCSWSRPAHSPVWGGLTMNLVTDAGIIDFDPFAPRVEGFSESARAALWLAHGTDTDALMLDEFLSAVREGRPPAPAGEVGVRTTAIVEAAYRSWHTGRVAAVAAVPAVPAAPAVPTAGESAGHRA